MKVPSDKRAPPPPDADYDPIAAEAVSGFQGLIGYRLLEWRDGFVRMAVDLRDHHRNRVKAVHGGLFTVVADAAGGFCGCYCPYRGRVRRAITLSLTTQFLGQPRDTLLLAEGRVVGGGRRIFFSEIVMTGGDGGDVARASGAYRYLGAAGDPYGEPAPAAD